MDTTRQAAEGKINELLDDAFSGTQVFQGGGNEIIGNDLQEMVLEAAENSLQRLYPQFHTGDHSAWDKVYSQAQKGAPDALKAIDLLKAPVKRVAARDVPMPFSPAMEDFCMPKVADVVEAARSAVSWTASR